MGGLSRSATKQAAAQRNGAKGGRPRAALVLARRVREQSAILGPKLPNIDPGDLALIIECMLKPPERRIRFARPIGGGRYAF